LRAASKNFGADFCGEFFLGEIFFENSSCGKKFVCYFPRPAKPRGGNQSAKRDDAVIEKVEENSKFRLTDQNDSLDCPSRSESGVARKKAAVLPTFGTSD
jgi:hypothetical protein